MIRILLVIGCIWGALAGAQQVNRPPRMINLEEYTRLRAEVTREVDALKERVAVLEKTCSGGPIMTYEVDTLAGKLRCRSCAQVEEPVVTLTKEKP